MFKWLADPITYHHFAIFSWLWSIYIYHELNMSHQKLREVRTTRCFRDIGMTILWVHDFPMTCSVRNMRWCFDLVEFRWLTYMKVRYLKDSLCVWYIDKPYILWYVDNLLSFRWLVRGIWMMTYWVCDFSTPKHSTKIYVICDILVPVGDCHIFTGAAPHMSVLVDLMPNCWVRERRWLIEFVKFRKKKNCL